MSNHIHNIVRGVCVKDGNILLAWHKKQEYFFLPGGHIEVGESNKTSLEREFLEELGVSVTCGDFLLLLEHSWSKGDETQHELTNVFSVIWNGGDAALQSRVDHLEFKWVSVRQIPSLTFLPLVLKDLIIQVATGLPVSRFVSTMK